MSNWSKSKRDFKVVISAGEYLQLCSWVLKHENIETGGDLFGLWADDRTAVIQLVVGPGRKCRRTSVSFYQDVEYLQEVGSYLTTKEGLCHIGEWHSHHQLGLAQPSGGDESTVWNNMPTYGLERFVIFIANIENGYENLNTNVGCFLFEKQKGTGRRLPVLQGQFVVKYEASPLRLKMESMSGNRAPKVFNEHCESLNSNQSLSSLKMEIEKNTGRIIRVSKKLAVLHTKKAEWTGRELKQREQSRNERTFSVVIAKEEYLQLCSWVLKHENIETGGDLFGLWADDRTAVIQLVVGPGRKCRRTSASFYQDVEYLQEVGSYLTTKEGLCHIGEWHSHHQLGLAQPSGGDESTVWNNMPTYGLNRFVIFIANLKQDVENLKTNVGCFLFEKEKGTGRRLPVLQGQFVVKNESSPVRSKMESMSGNRAAKVFTEHCESLNKILQVSKKRNILKPYYGSSNKKEFSGKPKGVTKETEKLTSCESGKTAQLKEKERGRTSEVQGNVKIVSSQSERGSARVGPKTETKPSEVRTRDTGKGEPI